MRVDVHNHAIPQEALRFIQSRPEFEFSLDGDTWATPHHGRLKLWPSMIDPEAKLSELGGAGLHAAVISTNPLLYYHDLDGPLVAELCEVVNDGLARFCQASPDRLRWMAQLPMQWPEATVSTLERAAAGGCVGVEIDTAIAGVSLDDPRFEPFWSMTEQLGLPVFLHPAYVPEPASIQDWYLHNVIGLQFQTTIAVERLICSGVLNRHPEQSLLLAHAGGYFPWQAGRLSHALTVAPELSTVARDPWTYLPQLYFDTITHDVAALRYLVDRVGVAQVMPGTDLPTHMADRQPMNDLIAAVGVGTAKVVAETNPARVFRFACADSGQGVARDDSAIGHQPPTKANAEAVQ